MCLRSACLAASIVACSGSTRAKADTAGCDAVDPLERGPRALPSTWRHLASADQLTGAGSVELEDCVAHHRASVHVRRASRPRPRRRRGCPAGARMRRARRRSPRSGQDRERCRPTRPEPPHPRAAWASVQLFTGADVESPVGRCPRPATGTPRSRRWPPRRCGRCRPEKLRRQLARVAERSPFYARKFADAGVDAARSATSTTSPRRRSPRSRSYARARSRAPRWARTPAVPMGEVIRVHSSSGTTGRPSYVGITRDDRDALDRDREPRLLHWRGSAPRTSSSTASGSGSSSAACRSRTGSRTSAPRSCRSGPAPPRGSSPASSTSAAPSSPARRPTRTISPSTPASGWRRIRATLGCAGSCSGPSRAGGPGGPRTNRRCLRGLRHRGARQRRHLPGLRRHLRRARRQPLRRARPDRARADRPRQRQRARHGRTGRRGSWWPPTSSATACRWCASGRATGSSSRRPRARAGARGHGSAASAARTTC